MNFTSEKPASFNREIILRAPLNGTRTELASINAPLYAAGMWGPALAFTYAGHTLYAPADCLIESIPETGYAVTIKTRHGLRLHINLLPAGHSLMGERCIRLVKAGEKVKVGQPLMSFQPQWLKQQGLPLNGVCCVMNGEKCKAVVHSHNRQFMAPEDPLIYVYI